MDWLRSNVTEVVGAVAAVLFILCIYLGRRVADLSRRLDTAVEAAEDAARAAALAAPGGIDPEVVITLLRAGHPANLDVVHAMMERQQAEAAAAAGVQQRY